MFSRIAKRYDFLNRLLSGGLDVYWRKKLRNLAIAENRSFRVDVADIATGTGDVAFEFVRQGKDTHDVQVVGVDISEEMLKIARKKAKQRGLEQQVSFQHGDALQLPLVDNSFNIVSMSFGIRNVPDYERALKEMVRIAKPGGKIVILEFSMPKNLFIQYIYKAYLKFLIPFIGGLFSERYAYIYLWKSIEEFTVNVNLPKLMQQAGLQNVQYIPLTFGVVTLYIGKKSTS